MSRFPFISLTLLCVLTQVNAQVEDIYSRLSEPYVQRPLTLYRGQLQFNAQFQHTTGNRYFDQYGSRLKFNESARNYLANNFHFEAGYGFLDLMDLSASISLYNGIETLPTYFLLNMETAGEFNTLFHTTGAGNLDLNLRVRQPFLSTGPDIAVSGGISIPVSSQDPRQPEHAILLYDPSDPGGSFELDYVYRPRPGYNSVFYRASLELKYRSDRYSLFLAGTWKAPFSAEETVRWDHRLYGEQFIYRSNPYNRLPPQCISLNAVLAMQLYPWFAVIASFRHVSETGGWTEESGSRVSTPSVTLGMISPACEIQVTTHLRFIQYFDIPLYGKEHYSEFTVRTGISYNLVPFKNLHY